MPADQHSQSVADAGYAALLARFERQPVRQVVDIPRERQPVGVRQLAVIPSRRFSSDMLTAAEKQAALQIRATWQLFTGGIVEQKGVYEFWRNACRLRFLSPLMCVEVVCLGLTLDDVDTRYKMRTGTALANLHGCLGLFSGQHEELVLIGKGA